NINSGAKISSGDAIGIKNATDTAKTAMDGGTVKSEHIAVDVTVGNMQFKKGVIENTYAGADTANRFALMGNTELGRLNDNSYSIIAKSSSLLWDKLAEHSLNYGFGELSPDKVFLIKTSM
ncbi:MAG: hypothetical protein RR978_09905, partial [Oscillospiraceae bacterium]